MAGFSADNYFSKTEDEIELGEILQEVMGNLDQDFREAYCEDLQNNKLNRSFCSDLKKEQENISDQGTEGQTDEKHNNEPQFKIST